MSAEPYHSNLGAWENEPVVQDQVLKYASAIGSAFLLREIYRPLGLPKEHVNRVLGRLHAKGVLTRWKIPVPSHAPGKRGRSATRQTVTRQCFLYRFAEAEAH
jgi:hypothetical protein